MIPNQVPSPSPILKEDSSAIQSGNSLEATKRSLKDPNHLALQRLGCHFFIRTIIREILRGYQSFQPLSRSQVFSISWTTQLVYTDSKQASCMTLAQLGQFTLHCGNTVTQFNSQDGQNCIGTNSDNTAGLFTFQDQPFSFSHILATFHHLGTFSPVS
ncbi:hypothetical protein O181_026028 [Austropuccinia psidii MF-1]|uniref:Uncharacterized protein n=1 Tax=Austropuccinia psidii MF-1 TaxID=1389203 RepID=A0A9Q3CP04_9BASI|nr:hypothetical protein [Austropuccinia psidii MF-1]